MIKRILFVDDEPLVLNGLQRLLRPMRNEWEMEFVDSGSKALQRLDQVPFDVIVADLRMPGMNGAELVAAVMARHPRTIRLILTGQSDKELMLQCVASTHQFLSKPCNPEELKTTIQRAAELDQELHNESLREVVSQMTRLPVLPAVYCEMLHALRDPDTSLEDVGAIVARDIAMSAQILKLVNSAYFGLRRPVANLGEAIGYVGIDTVKSLVLSMSIFSQFDDAGFPTFSPSALWNHSLKTAGIARALAHAEDAPRRVADEAFVAGLLHDAGKLVFASNYRAQYPEALRRARTERIELRVAELGLFRATHAEVGAYLLGLWGIPDPIVRAVGFHHDPLKSGVEEFSAVTAVHTANVLSQPPPDPASGLRLSQLDAEYLARLGLTGRVDAWKEIARQPRS